MSEPITVGTPLGVRSLELEALAARHARLGHEVDELADRCRACGRALLDDPRLGTASAWLARAGDSAALAGALLARAAAERLALAVSVHAAAERYDEIELHLERELSPLGPGRLPSEAELAGLLGFLPLDRLQRVLTVGGLRAATAPLRIALTRARPASRCEADGFVNVWLRRVKAQPRPTTLEGVLRRIPSGPSSMHGQVRVEEYLVEGRRVWLVAIDGTRDWSPLGGTEPSNLAENIALMTGDTDRLTRGIVVGLRQAGVQEGDAVVLAGYSQGGIAAQALTMSGEFNVVSLTTMGSPLLPTFVSPPGVDTLRIEHRDDAVPALGGSLPTSRSDNDVVVQARAVPEGERNYDPFAAHERRRYLATAASVDEASAAPEIGRHLDATLGPIRAASLPVASFEMALAFEEPKDVAVPRPAPTPTSGAEQTVAGPPPVDERAAREPQLPPWAAGEREWHAKLTAPEGGPHALGPGLRPGPSDEPEGS